jgi:hypothetical protein
MGYRAWETELPWTVDAEGGCEADCGLPTGDEPCADAGDLCGRSQETAPPAPGDRYPLLFHRVARRVAGEEERACRDRAAADGLYEELMRVPEGERAQVVEIHDRYVSFAFAERLLATSFETRTEHPEASLELARLALGVADRLDPTRYGSGLVADLKARSWAYLGNAWADTSPPAAREAFRLARSLLRRGSGDPLEEAEVLALAATGPGEPGTAESAADELERAESIFRAARETRRLTEILVAKARLRARGSEPLRAVAILREATRVLRELADARRIAEIGTEIAFRLEAAGCADEAWTEVARVRSLAGRDLDSGLAHRLRWIEGRVATSLGLAEEARKHLEAARDGLLEAGRAREAALVQLDLAALATRSDGEAYDREMARLEAEVPRLVAAGGLPREYTTALLLLGQAAERRALRPELVDSMGGLLRHLG